LLSSGIVRKRRPLLSMEIANLFDNIQRNALEIATFIGFSQVAESKEVENFMVRGKEIATKIGLFYVILTYLTNDMDAEVSTSKVAPFSDKLMMAQTTA
jgi:hypothetical protein